jgi:hypothetical protein
MTTNSRANKSSEPNPTVLKLERWGLKLERWVEATWPLVLGWWKPQTPGMKLALAAVGLVVAATCVNLVGAGVGRFASGGAPSVTSAPAVAPNAVPALAQESAPADQGKAWTVVKVWQASASRETEVFAVGAHWRIDWLFNPTDQFPSLQVFIYSADGKLLMNMAANTQKVGADSSFWAGPGRYLLKINSNAGDWKVAVQDLR